MVYALPTASRIIGMLFEIIDILYPNKAIMPSVQTMAMATVSNGNRTPLMVLKKAARITAISRKAMGRSRVRSEEMSLAMDVTIMGEPA